MLGPNMQRYSTWNYLIDNKIFKNETNKFLIDNHIFQTNALKGVPSWQQQ